MSQRCTQLGLLAVIAALAWGSWPSSSHAANLEPAGINLGGTSFFDGFGRNEEGFTYLAYAQWATAHTITDEHGKPSPYFTDPRIDAFVLLNQLAYTLPQKLFGDQAHVGMNFILPIVGFDTSFTVRPPGVGTLTHSDVGLGDLTFGPFLQFRPLIAGGRPVFSHRFEIDAIAPTGKFDPYKDINPGANFASLVPYWAATVLPLPHLEISARFHFLYNFPTDRPALGRLWSLTVPPKIKRAQAGQASWINFAASYELVHTFHLGVNGYYFFQYNEDLWEMEDGSSNPGRSYNDFGKSSVLGVGPGLLWEVAGSDRLYANFYFQPVAYVRAKGDVLNLRWVHPF